MTKQQPIGVTIIVINKQNQILLGKRKNGYKPGTFGLPGGRVDVGEPLVQAGLRELTEEVGIISQNLEYIGLVRETQTEYDFVHFGFVCTDWQGSIENCEPEKCEGWEWYDLKNLPQPLLRGHQGIIELYVDPKGRNLIELLKDEALSS